MPDLQEIADYVAKSSKLVRVTVHDSCVECGNGLSMLTYSTNGGRDVVCNNCGKANYIYAQDKHKKELIDAATKETDQDISQNQRHAGNYRKGKFSWQDLTIAIENPAGSTRRGVDKAGKMWETKLKDHYGYILKHVSEADGDHMDVFIPNEPDFHNHSVYVIDQYIGGKFDEHKCVILCKDAKEAKAVYKRNYQDDWKGFENLSVLSLAEFKRWLGSGDTDKPLFDKVPPDDIRLAEQAVQACCEREKSLDPTGDDSGGYGDVILCKRQKKAWIISGDWWSREVCDLWKKTLQEALPSYDWQCEAESFPNGWEKDNFGDWAHIKRK